MILDKLSVLSEHLFSSSIKKDEDISLTSHKAGDAELEYEHRAASSCLRLVPGMARV